MESLCDDDAVIIERTRRTDRPEGASFGADRGGRRFSLSARLTSARIYVGAKRVLVVDLDLETPGHLRDAFGREGCELRHASSCSEAIALAESRDPCLILLDVSVSELAGLGFVDRFELIPVRRSSFYPRAKVNPRQPPVSITARTTSSTSPSN